MLGNSGCAVRLNVPDIPDGCCVGLGQDKTAYESLGVFQREERIALARQAQRLSRMSGPAARER